ncbi:MAG: hypothetical protein JOZ77_03275 [Candidatus Eremiobacteraeota bacterium]|nr:hypothetical protein [Candidatus Eremiobacteraeota bacterium]
MHVTSKIRRRLGPAVACALLAACSAGAPGTMTPNAPQRDASGARTENTTIFISGSNPSAVYVLNSKGDIVSTLTDDLNVPQGLAVDRSGDLYVANLGAPNILVFAPPYTGTPTVISDEAGASPLDVAVDASGNLAVANLSTASGNGDVVLYAAGATSPTSIISSPNFQQPRYCAFDKHGNLFLDNIQTSEAPRSHLGVAGPGDRSENVTIGEIRGGLHGTSITQLQTSNQIDNGEAGSVQVTSSGKIAIDNYVTPGGTGGNIYTYGAPKHNDLGAPAMLHLRRSIQPTTFAFTVGSKRLFTADYSLDAAQAYTYPGGRLLKTFHFPSRQLVQGVAIYPNQQFP